MGKEPGVVSLDTLGGKGTDEILTQLIKYANSFFYRVFFLVIIIIIIKISSPDRVLTAKLCKTVQQTISEHYNLM